MLHPVNLLRSAGLLILPGRGKSLVQRTFSALVLPVVSPSPAYS